MKNGSGMMHQVSSCCCYFEDNWLTMNIQMEGTSLYQKKRPRKLTLILPGTHILIDPTSAYKAIPSFLKRFMRCTASTCLEGTCTTISIIPVLIVTHLIANRLNWRLGGFNMLVSRTLANASKICSETNNHHRSLS